MRYNKMTQHIRRLFMDIYSHSEKKSIKEDSTRHDDSLVCVMRASGGIFSEKVHVIVH